MERRAGDEMLNLKCQRVRAQIQKSYFETGEGTPSKVQKALRLYVFEAIRIPHLGDEFIDIFGDAMVVKLPDWSYEAGLVGPPYERLILQKPVETLNAPDHVSTT